MPPPKTYTIPFSKKLAVVSISVLLVFITVVVVQAIWTHDAALDRGKVIAQRLTNIQSDHLELTFQAINLTLRGATNRHYYNSLLGESNTDDFAVNFTDWVDETPQIAWVLMSDKKGKISMLGSKNSYKNWAKETDSIAEEEYFKHHKKNIGTTEGYNNLSIAISTEEDAINQKVIILSRSLYNFDGSFAGVIAAAVDSDYFFQFFRSIEIGDKMSMAISTDNGMLVLIGDKKTDIATIADLVKTQPKEDYKKEVLSEVSKREDATYIVSYKELRNLPISISLVFEEQQVLSSWRSDRITDLVFLILFTVFGTVLFTLILAMAKQIQRAEQSEKTALLANQAKSEFLAKMSHELRTPLNAIIGFSEMIDSGYFGPLNNKKQQERVHDIHLCGNHLLQLINDILDYSKGEAGKLELRENEMGMQRVINESIRIISERAKQKKIEIAEKIPEDLSRIIADERKLKQIMINLLSNAIKFTGEGKKVTIIGEDLPSGGIKITVKDEGIGIAEEDIPVALSVFGQVRHPNPENEEEGTGLGLPLCKMLTELHGGIFTLESGIGKGTSASFTIPKARVVSAKKQAKAAKSA